MAESTRLNICCLKRIGTDNKAHKIVPLEDINELTVGRSLDAVLCLPSTMISRYHATLRKEESGHWTVTDNKSLNGVFVNGTRLKAQQAHVLRDGETVQFGVPVKEGTPPEFMFKFHKSLKVKKVASIQGQAPDQRSDLSNQSSNKKRKSDENTELEKKKESPRIKRLKSEAVKEKRVKWSPSPEVKEELAQRERDAAARLQEQEKQLAQMQEMLEEKELAQAAMAAELKEREEQLRQELQQKQKEMDLQRKKFEEEMKQAYEEQLQQKEASLLESLANQQQELKQTRVNLQERLQTEMSRKLEEKDKQLENELRQQKENLDKVIEQKELRQKMLESELEQTRDHSSKEEEVALRAKEDMLSNFAELMETELQCSICSELFIQATSLQCSHSYCALCIEQWIDVKKECPNCRAPITSQVRSIVLDSYIDKMVEHLSDEMKEKRKQLVEDRKAEQQKREEAKTKPETSGRGRGRRVRGRGRGRRGASSPARGRRATTPPVSPSRVTRSTRPTAVLISSDSDDDSDDLSNSFDSLSEDSDDSVPGMPGTYYGGYGFCYNCGRRGHWANGCPY